MERGGRGWRGEKREGRSSGGGTEIRSGGLRERLRSSRLSTRSVHVRRSKIGGAKAPPPLVLPPLGRRVEGKDNGRQKEGGGVKDKTKEACTHTKDNLATKAKSKT